MTDTKELEEVLKLSGHRLIIIGNAGIGSAQMHALELFLHHSQVPDVILFNSNGIQSSLSHTTTLEQSKPSLTLPEITITLVRESLDELPEIATEFAEAPKQKLYCLARNLNTQIRYHATVYIKYTGSELSRPRPPTK